MEKKNQIPKYPHLRFPEFTDEWKECKISDYGTVVTGSTPSTKDVENYEDDGFLWASPADIDGSKFIERTKITLSSKGFNRTRKLPPLSVLVVCIGSIGKIAMAKNEMATNQQINSIVVNPLHSPGFVYYAIISRFRSYLSAVAVQVVPIISKSTFERLPNSTTSLPEQRKIAALLSLIDERIEVQNAIIKEQEALKASLLRRLFDRTLSFPEFTDEWKEYQNSEVFEIISEKNTDLKYSNVVSASMNHGVVLRDEIGIDIKYEQENIRGYKVVRDGDYIVHLRSFQGGFAFSRLNGICSPAYTILRPRPNMLEYGFLEAYFYSSRFITSLKQVTYGIRDGRSISIGEWMQEKTSLPSLPEQRKIAALLSAVDELIAVEKEYATLLQKQKAYLLRQMFV